MEGTSQEPVAPNSLPETRAQLALFYRISGDYTSTGFRGGDEVTVTSVFEKKPEQSNLSPTFVWEWISSGDFVTFIAENIHSPNNTIHHLKQTFIYG
jgi:hypothetical protein